MVFMVGTGSTAAGMAAMAVGTGTVGEARGFRLAARSIMAGDTAAAPYAV